MQAKIIERKWVVEWFDERQCYHMSSLTLADNGNLLAVWNGGFLQWNGDPMGRGRKGLGLRARKRQKAPGRTRMRWAATFATAAMTRSGFKNKMVKLRCCLPQFLDTEVNFSTWCNGRDELLVAQNADGGRTWLPAHPANIHLRPRPATTACFCRTERSSLPARAASSRISTLAQSESISAMTTGKTFETGPLSIAEDGNLIRELALACAERGRPPLFRALSRQRRLGVGGQPFPAHLHLRKPRRRAAPGQRPVPSGILNNESKIDVISWDDDTILMRITTTPERRTGTNAGPLTLAMSRDEGKT
jgi:hypothetical protein